MVHSVDRIGAGQLVDGDDRGRITVKPSDLVVLLSAQLHPSYILHSDKGAVRIGANDDVAKFLCGQQATLRPNRVGELLAARYGLGTDLAGGVDGILIVERVDDIADGDTHTGQGVGPYPVAHLREDLVSVCVCADVKVHPQPHQPAARVDRGHVDHVVDTL